MASSQAPFAAKAKVACAGGLADGIAANRPWPAFLELFFERVGGQTARSTLTGRSKGTDRREYSRGGNIVMK
jgi:hypothetical protein